ncbi:transposase [Rufibacter hautae]|uniref:Transposase n=2 Tax=Rufibacter hautae TaxID=2595005 RepID=A0A5B6TNG8_9BACT|nr:transposase [Rufibacter hautae]
MSDKFQNKYRIASTRLQHWDYGWNAAYFVTICTKDRAHFFGQVLDGEMYLSETGKLALTFWAEIPNHFPFVELDAFVVMPNHVHGILLIQKPENGLKNTPPPVETRHRLVSTLPDPSLASLTITDPISPDAGTTYTQPKSQTLGQARFTNPPKHTLSSIIGSYKSVVTKYARKISGDFAWQSGFHDHIIRSHSAHEKIEDYILHNPARWEQDKFYG